MRSPVNLADLSLAKVRRVIQIKGFSVGNIAARGIEQEHD
jgi:hypothetical protein